MKTKEELRQFKVVKSQGKLYLGLRNGDLFLPQYDMQIQSNATGCKDYVIVNVGIRVYLEDFCTEEVNPNVIPELTEQEQEVILLERNKKGI